MAEYYPLLAKAVGSLPNSTPETRRVVYERARKALIGQLRTLHPPVPEDDIERESVELDRAVERLERELAQGIASAPAAVRAPSMPAAKPAPGPITGPHVQPRSALPRSAPSPSAPERTAPQLRTKVPVPRTSGALPAAADPEVAAVPPSPPVPDAASAVPPTPPPPPPARPEATEISSSDASLRDGGRPRLESQRPIAPQPPTQSSSNRRLWIVPVAIGLLVVVGVAVAAWKLRDTRQTVAKSKPTEQVAQSDNGKISERVGSATPDGGQPSSAEPPASPPPTATPTADQAAAPAGAPTSSPPSNPELPVAQRAALLVEAPDEPNKVKTFIGTVVWKLDNVSTGPGDSVGLAVEADIDVPDDKLKASITFEKNTDASLPASHTIKLHFTMASGSATGDVKQISVPQLRREDNPSGEALAGVTVPVVQNSFLVGLSPGNAETVNLRQLKEMQWIDVPMLLSSGRIAKLTFEKGSAGDRDLQEAIAAWQKS